MTNVYAYDLTTAHPMQFDPPGRVPTASLYQYALVDEGGKETWYRIPHHAPPPGLGQECYRGLGSSGKIVEIRLRSCASGSNNRRL
jgi:hypothetical protein